MSRQKRFYLAGASFHVTARTLNHEPWFDETLRDRVVAILAECFSRSDAKLIAYVVMPNHFHLVVRQQRLPLGHIMQRVCRSVALAVNHAREREGYVFERRYRAKACLDPDYLRDAISYVHLNPRRAGLCTELHQYQWSSHPEYAQCAPNRLSALVRPHLTTALELYSPRGPLDASRQILAYLAYLAWQESRHQESDDRPPPPRPRCAYGDHYWRTNFTTLTLPLNPKPDLRDIVLRVLQEETPGVNLNILRLRRGGTAMVRVRHRAIERAYLAGYRGVDVARFLNISETTVSKVCTSLVASGVNALAGREPGMGGWRTTQERQDGPKLQPFAQPLRMV